MPKPQCAEAESPNASGAEAKGARFGTGLGIETEEVFRDDKERKSELEMKRKRKGDAT